MDEAMQRLLHQPRGSLLLLLLLLLLHIFRILYLCGIVPTSSSIESLRTLQMLRNFVRTHKQRVVQGTLLGVDRSAARSPAGTVLVQAGR